MSAIVVYDQTCRGPSGPLGVELPGLTSAWRAGGRLYRALGRYDHVIGAARWADALRAVRAATGRGGLDELQFWCHGKWGKVFLANNVLDLAALETDHELAPGLDALREAIRGPKSLVWFRTCETFGGEPGQRFAEALAERLGCRVAGYTYIIGPLQSGLHALTPGQRAGWSDTEGLLEGTGASPVRAAWSALRAPRTITCFHSTLPRWADDPASGG